MKVTWIETSNDRADNPSRDKRDESIVHNPNLYFKLKTGGEITSQTIRDSFFRWGKGANGKLMPVVEYSFFLKGTFTDEFNLLVFPFDLLALKIKVFSTKPASFLINFH
jgi:hypothetical protein